MSAVSPGADDELDQVFAGLVTTDLVEIDKLVLQGDEGIERLTAHLDDRIERVREALRPHKKPAS